MAKDLKGRELPAGVRQRQNGRYEGRVQYEGDRYSVYADTITEVRRLMTETKYKLEHGEFIAETKITLDAWFSTWIDQYRKGRVKEGTILAYQNYYKYLDSQKFYKLKKPVSLHIL